MPSLPVLSGQEAVRVFEKFGWQFVRRRGSHLILVKTGSPATLSVPDHREVAKGTLRSLMRAAGIPHDAFCDAARQ